MEELTRKFGEPVRVTSEDLDAASLTIKPSAPRSFSWTTEKPTAPGWYWFRGKIRDLDNCGPWLQEILEWGSGLAVECGNEGMDSLDLYVGEWAGPLEPPA